MSVRGGLLPAETRDGAVLPIILEMTKAGKSPQPQPDFTVNYRQKCYQPLLLLQKGRVGALQQLAQDLEQTALDVGSLPTSQLQGVIGVEQFLLDAPVSNRWPPNSP